MPTPDIDREFSRLLSEPNEMSERAPSSLKARLYSALVCEQQATGPLASLNQTLTSGRGICVFEKLVQIAPVGEATKSMFFCQYCHARVLAEALDTPPIYWRHCPYVAFKG